MPFWPGGLDDVRKDTFTVKELDETSNGLRKVPPGLSRGLRLPGAELEDMLIDLEGISHKPSGGDIPVRTRV